MAASAQILAAALAVAVVAHPAGGRSAHHGGGPPPPAPPATGIKLGPAPHYEAPPPQARRESDHDRDHDHWRRHGRLGGFEGGVWTGRSGEHLIGEAPLSGAAGGLVARPVCGVMLHWSDRQGAAERQRVC
ncbi:hypothetical protein [Phenylobacterium montanum]|uniref:Uncharacterized protein n=1 Tax=Phenylobacterium montanum TaxID=2823693 RepID=A0A975G362_9CAUL|nr:hypothetical protein [Caulobacter sp. S6]QUD89944.1 hypothetical protein KCG34_08790 [Caulobacter sp. S6]